MVLAKVLFGLLVALALLHVISADVGVNCSQNGNADCTGTGEICLNTTCICNDAHKDGAGNTCVPKVLGDSCSVPNDCMAVTNANCSGSSVCVCLAEYTAFGGNCVKGLGNACIAGQCAVSNSECDTTATNTCVCSSGYTAEGSKCAHLSNAGINIRSQPTWIMSVIISIAAAHGVYYML